MAFIPFECALCGIPTDKNPIRIAILFQKRDESSHSYNFCSIECLLNYIDSNAMMELNTYWRA